MMLVLAGPLLAVSSSAFTAVAREQQGAGTPVYGLNFFFQAEDGIRDVADWSSDVCSSDLPRRDGARGEIPLERHSDRPGLYAHHRSDGRSEERRVGKECRSRWSPYH